MNRAIYLAQLDPTEGDLLKITISILSSYSLPGDCFPPGTLQMLCKSYLAYIAQQLQEHFHGLRDFYALIKSFREAAFTSAAVRQRCLRSALARNFGGSPRDLVTAKRVFLEEEMGGEGEEGEVLKLIRANLEDEEARHLLLITQVSLLSRPEHLQILSDSFWGFSGFESVGCGVLGSR